MDNYSVMYEKLPNLVFVFHGCDQETYEKVLYRHEELTESNNKYDWLGSGIYFWENSYQRAYEWAEHNSKYDKPAVIGAVIDLGRCLNLTDYGSSEILKKGYDLLKTNIEIAQGEMPKNKKGKHSDDVLLRDLDCAVIQQIHRMYKEAKLPPYDSVRGVFIEGEKVYPGAEFYEKTHIQLCITNPNCIKGYFDPRKSNDTYEVP